MVQKNISSKFLTVCFALILAVHKLVSNFTKDFHFKVPFFFKINFRHFHWALNLSDGTNLSRWNQEIFGSFFFFSFDDIAPKVHKFFFTIWDVWSERVYWYRNTQIWLDPVQTVLCQFEIPLNLKPNETGLFLYGPDGGVGGESLEVLATSKGLMSDQSKFLYIFFETFPLNTLHQFCKLFCEMKQAFQTWFFEKTWKYWPFFIHKEWEKWIMLFLTHEEFFFPSQILFR